MHLKGNARDGDVCTQTLDLINITHKSSEVAHAYDPRTHKMGTGRSAVQGHHRCHSELRASLGCVKRCLRGNTKRKLIICKNSNEK